jgi:hypothetical protein
MVTSHWLGGLQQDTDVEQLACYTGDIPGLSGWAVDILRHICTLPSAMHPRHTHMHTYIVNMIRKWTTYRHIHIYTMSYIL